MKKLFSLLLVLLTLQVFGIAQTNTPIFIDFKNVGIVAGDLTATNLNATNVSARNVSSTYFSARSTVTSPVVSASTVNAGVVKASVIQAPQIAGSFTGDGSKLTNVNTTPVPITRVTYVAPRTDGKAGTGTFNDPFDASTPEKLMQVWKNVLYQNVSVPHRKFVFMPGVYFVADSLYLPVGAQKLTISGYGATVCLTNSAALGQYHMFIASWYGAGWATTDDVTFEGLELDCGTYVKFVGDGKTCGIISIGNRNIIRDCIIRNIISANFTNNVNEAFAIIMHGTNHLCLGNVVDNLLAPSGQGGGTAIVMVGDGGVCEGNIVNLRDPSPTNSFYSFAYSLYASDTLLVGNASLDVDAALSMDAAGNGEITNTWSNNLIVGNQLDATALTIRVHPNLQAYRDWHFVGNNIKTESEWIELFHHTTPYMSNKVTGFSFVGNRFFGKPRRVFNMAFNTFDWHSFIGNTFSTNVNIAFGTNKNTLFGLGNHLNGQPHNDWLGVRESTNTILVNTSTQH